MTTPQHAFRSGFFAVTGAAVALLCLFAIYIGGQALLSIATPFLAGGICALLLDPVVMRLEHIHRITRGNRSIAVAISGIGFLIIFAALIILIVPVLVAQVRALMDWVSSDGPAELQAWADTWLASHRKIGPFALPATRLLVLAPGSMPGSGRLLVSWLRLLKLERPAWPSSLGGSGRS